MKNTNLAKVNTMTPQIMKAAKCSRSEAMKAAYQTLKMDGSKTLTFEKLGGELTRRIVACNFTKFYQPNGNSKLAVGQKPFVDLAKVAANSITGKNGGFVISTFQNQIIAFA